VTPAWFKDLITQKPEDMVNLCKKKRAWLGELSRVQNSMLGKSNADEIWDMKNKRAQRVTPKSPKT